MKIYQKRALNMASMQGGPSCSFYYSQLYHSVYSYMVCPKCS